MAVRPLSNRDLRVARFERSFVLISAKGGSEGLFVRPELVDGRFIGCFVSRYARFVELIKSNLRFPNRGRRTFSCLSKRKYAKRRTPRSLRRPGLYYFCRGAGTLRSSPTPSARRTRRPQQITARARARTPSRE